MVRMLSMAIKEILLKICHVCDVSVVVSGLE